MDRRIVWVAAAGAAVALGMVGCSGKSTAFVCAGTVQARGMPETLQPTEPVVVRITEYPAYTRLWSKSWGDVEITEPKADNFMFVQTNGADQLLISADKGTPSGIFNRISGRLQIAAAGGIYDVTCRRREPLV